MDMFETGRKQQEKRFKQEGRLPAGQSLTLKWPVLHYGAVPRFDPATWDFRAFGLVDEPRRWSYAEFMNLPKIQVKSDIHCVTRWSKLDNLWEGVAFKEVLRYLRVKPEANHVLFHDAQGYTANVPLPDLMREDVLFAYRHDGEDISPDHGWPLRLLVPHLYLWKSVKWVRAMEFLDRETPGFWEQNGYHIYGDPWKEQRFTDD